MKLIADVVVVFADLTVGRAHFGFCSSAKTDTSSGRQHSLGTFLLVGALGILGLLELVVCLGAGGGLLSPGT